MRAYETRAELRAEINDWKAARRTVMQGQEYTIGTRRLRRADLSYINETIKDLCSQITDEDDRAGRGSLQFHELIPRRYS